MPAIRRAELACGLGAGGAGLAALAYNLFAPVLRDGSTYTAADGSLITTMHYVSGIQRGMTPFYLYFFIAVGLTGCGVALSAVLHVRTHQRAWRTALVVLTSALLLGVVMLSVIYLPNIWRLWNTAHVISLYANALFLPSLALAVLSAMMAFRMPTHRRNQIAARDLRG